jgi:hypothetical protein
LSEEVSAARQALADLGRCVEKVRDRYGDTSDVRRLLSDVLRVAEDLDEIAPPARGEPTLELVPDFEYHTASLADSDDEGLGFPGRK